MKKPRIKPPFIALICLGLMWLLDKLFPGLQIINYPYTEFGILFIGVGAVFLIWSFCLFKKYQTPIIPGKKPTFVVMDGPYKFTRNPMYFSVTMILFGAAIMFGNALAFLGPLAFFLIIRKTFVPFEEQLMEELFGKKYIEYKKRVRRWL